MYFFADLMCISMTLVVDLTRLFTIQEHPRDCAIQALLSTSMDATNTQPLLRLPRLGQSL